MGTGFSYGEAIEKVANCWMSKPNRSYQPERNSYIEHSHRGMKEEEVCLAEYGSLEEARESI